MGSRGVQLMKLTISGSTNGTAAVPWIWRRFLSVALSPLLFPFCGRAAAIANREALSAVDGSLSVSQSPLSFFLDGAAVCFYHRRRTVAGAWKASTTANVRSVIGTRTRHSQH